MKELGILLNQSTGDLDIKIVKDKDGKIIQGLQVDDVTKQNMAIILQMNEGELKEQPTIGVGIDNMLLSHDSLLYKHKIRQQFGADGLQVNYLEINGENIDIDANY